MIFKRPDSAFWWALLEGTGRRRINTGIRCDASTPELRKQNREAAEAIYHARMTQLARGRAGLPVESAETFTTFSTWYETHHLARHRAAARERYILTRLQAHFGAMRLAEIRPARWTEYETARRAEGAAVNTVGRELALMKGILATAVGEHLEVSPLAHVTRKVERLPAKRTVTKAEEVQLLEELHDDEIRDIYLVAVGTLLRQQNVVTLRRREHRGHSLALMTKTGPHQVGLEGPTLLQRRAALVLRRRMPKKADGYFFPRWGARFTANRDSANAQFLKLVRRAVKRAKLPWGLQTHGVVWHTLTRASGATRMLREHGCDIRTVQLLGGWRSLDQMAEYLGVDLSAPSAGSRTVPAARRRA